MTDREMDAVDREIAAHEKELTALRTEIAKLAKERDALAKFKGYVHERLDAAGIPTHPDGPHSKEGCRIGDRLDIALGPTQGMGKLVRELHEAKEAAESALSAVEQEACGFALDAGLEITSEKCDDCAITQTERGQLSFALEDTDHVLKAAKEALAAVKADASHADGALTFVTQRLVDAVLSTPPVVWTKSLIRQNAEKWVEYVPYCLRCPGLVRMRKVAPFRWRCACGAEHVATALSPEPKAGEQPKLPRIDGSATVAAAAPMLGAEIDLENLCCAFCLKHRRDVRHMIKAPNGIALCNECIALCSQILEGTPAPDLVGRPDVLRIVREQPNAAGTRVGTRQQWVRDEIAKKVEALPALRELDTEDSEHLRERIKELEADVRAYREHARMCRDMIDAAAKARSQSDVYIGSARSFAHLAAAFESPKQLWEPAKPKPEEKPERFSSAVKIMLRQNAHEAAITKFAEESLAAISKMSKEVTDKLVELERAHGVPFEAIQKGEPRREGDNYVIDWDLVPRQSEPLNHGPACPVHDGGACAAPCPKFRGAK
jgi:cell division septum initiation protein DivIVA